MTGTVGFTPNSSCYPMNLMRKLVRGFAVFSLFGQLLLAADHLGQLKPGASATDLLDGRLTIHFPAEAKIEAMQHGIMAAPESNAEQTRTVIDAGGQRMVIMTYELFTSAGRDFKSSVERETAEFPMKVSVQEWPLASPLSGYAYFPQTPTQSKEANLVMGLFVARSDRAMQALMVYVNPAGARNFAEASTLAKAICKTVAEGKRMLNSGGGERELSSYSGQKAILITLPQGYVATLQNGVDFVVHHIHKITAFGGIPSTIGIYLGDHPEQHNDYTKKTSGNIFGKSVDWYEKAVSKNDESYLVDDAVVSLGSGLWNRDLPSYADVFLTAPDPSGMEELRKVASTLRIGNSKAHR